MNVICHVTIPWKKHAKQRPRTGRGHTYTPKATQDAEKIIRTELAKVWSGEPSDKPLGVVVVMSKAELEIKVVEVEGRDNNSLNGDIDNYAKTVLDALNGVVWVDDKQIDCLVLEKH